MTGPSEASRAADSPAKADADSTWRSYLNNGDLVGSGQRLSRLRKELAVTSSAKVRALMGHGGFFDQGHASLIPLKEKLQDESVIMEPKDLIKDLSDVCTQTSELVRTLSLISSDLLHEGTLNRETKGHVERLVVQVYGKYDTEELPAATKALIANCRPGFSQTELVEELLGIIQCYRNLRNEKEEIEKQRRVLETHADAGTPMDYSLGTC